jgi:signal transduction histidine kinase
MQMPQPAAEPRAPLSTATSPRREAAYDFVAVAVVVLLSGALSAHFELSESLYRVTRGWEHLQLDELPVVLIALSVGLMWFSHRRHRRTRYELHARREAEARLAEAFNENRRLAQQHLRLQEAERKHLARELHDELGQYLNAIKLDAVSIRDHARGEPQHAAVAAADIVRSADHVHRTIADMIRRLRPVGLDELGLAAALEHSMEHWRRRMPATSFSIAVEGDLDALGETLNLTVYRLLQEALTNCSRHANARHIDIALRRRSDANATDCVTLTVADDGCGMAPGALFAGFGLSGMRERVELLSGELVLDTALGRGLRLEARLPVSQERETWRRP